MQITKVENDTEKIVQLMNDFFCGAYFEGYKFDTSFTLRFGRDNIDDLTTRKSTMSIDLFILGRWLFHTESEWSSRLSMLKNLEALDLEEPLLAFELTRLRWSEDSKVCSVSLENEILEIKFNNLCQIRISCEPIEGESWIMTGKNNDLIEDEMWSITCEGGEYYTTIT